jgi:hypothetical protein
MLLANPACVEGGGILRLRKNVLWELDSNRTGNTSRLRYRAQPVNAVWGNSRCLL